MSILPVNCYTFTTFETFKAIRGHVSLASVSKRMLISWKRYKNTSIELTARYRMLADE